MGCHPSRQTRFSWDASTFDYICELCGNTDYVPDGWGELAHPCPNNPDYKVQADNASDQSTSSPSVEARSEAHTD